MKPVVSCLLANTQYTPAAWPPRSDLEERELQQHKCDFILQELEARKLEIERRSQSLQQHQLQLQAPAIATATVTATALAIAAAPARAPPLYSDRRDLEAIYTAPSRKSSAVESDGSTDLSGLTQRDSVPPLSVYIARASESTLKY